MITTKRIEFEKIDYSQLIKPTEKPDEIGENEISDTLPQCEIQFSLEGTNLSGFGPHTAAVVRDDNGYLHQGMGGWPETEISFTVTEDDLPRVNAWFNDDYRGVTLPESGTLQKNRAAAVHGALTAYIEAASASNLFTAPFRIGWRYRMKDGSVGTFHDCGLLAAFVTAPRLPLISYSISGKSLFTRAQIRNVPARLFFRVVLHDTVSFDKIAEKADSIEVFATRQTAQYSSSATVAGIRSIVIDETPKRCWHYDRYDEADIILRTTDNDDFRLLSSISFDEIDKNGNFIPVPIAAGTLMEFSSLPRHDGNHENLPSAPAGSTIVIATGPLNLGYPDIDKRLRSLAVRGVFQRDKIKLRLFASRHRENWHKIAETTSPFIFGMRGVKWRWYKVEIECPMRENDFLEALTFTFRHP